MHRPSGSAPPANKTEQAKLRRSERTTNGRRTATYLEALNKEVERKQQELEQRKERHRRETRIVPSVKGKEPATHHEESEESDNESEATTTVSDVQDEEKLFPAEQKARQRFDELQEELHILLQEYPQEETEEQLQYFELINETYQELQRVTIGVNQWLENRYGHHINTAKARVDTAEQEHLEDAQQEYVQWQQFLDGRKRSIDPKLEERIFKLWREIESEDQPPTTPEKESTHEDIPETPRPPKQSKPEKNDEKKDTMVNEGLGFKPPTPRIYSGDNEDRDASNLEAWIDEVKDYIEMLSITDDKTKLLLLQYFLSKTAKDFYHTKRKETGITFEGFLESLKEYIIPSTQINRYWDDWYKISQVHGGKIDRITATAIRLEKAANKLGTAISNQVKI